MLVLNFSFIFFIEINTCIYFSGKCRFPPRLCEYLLQYLLYIVRLPISAVVLQKEIDICSLEIQIKKLKVCK